MRRKSEIRNPMSDRCRRDARRAFQLGISLGLRLTLLLSLAPASISAQPTHLERAPMHFGLTRSTFRNVNPTDAEAALRVLAQTVGRQHGCLRDLHLEPAGRQILTRFKVDQLVPFKEEYLEGVRNLRARAARLKAVRSEYSAFQDSRP